MSEQNRFTEERALYEANLMQKKLSTGEAETYAEAEREVIDEILQEIAGKLQNAFADSPILLNQETALKLIEAGEIRLLINRLWKFKELNQEVALKLMEAGAAMEVGHNLEQFEGLSAEIALELIEAGAGWYVAANLEKFIGLNQEVALQLIKLGTKRSTGPGGAVAYNLERFKGADHQEIASKLIEAGIGDSVAVNLDKFIGLDHKNIALELIAKGAGRSVAENFEKFEGVDHQLVAEKLIEAGIGDSIAENLKKFKGLDQEVALKLIETRHTNSVATHLGSFEGLNQEIALELMKAGEWGYVSVSLERFTGLNQEVALELIATGHGKSVVERFEKFQGLNKEVALRLIASKNGQFVCDHLEKFGDIDHKEIALKLISAGNAGDFGGNIEKFNGLDREVALRFIESGWGGGVIPYYLKKFQGLDHKEIIVKILGAENGRECAEFVLCNLDNFEGITSAYLIEQFSPLAIFIDTIRPMSEQLAEKFETVLPVTMSYFLMNDEERKAFPEVLSANPFLMAAVEANPSYGVKLALKFPELDDLSKENIRLLYEVKEGKGEVFSESPEFRALVQKRLKRHKNNVAILKAVEEQGVNTDSWLNYAEEVSFDLGEEEEASFSEKVKLPISRLGETVGKYESAFKAMLQPQRAELMQKTVEVKPDGIEEQIVAMRQQLDLVLGDEKKTVGIQKGIAGLEKKIATPKTVPLWEKLMGDLSLVTRVKNDTVKAYKSIEKTEQSIDETSKEALPTAEKRKKMVAAKRKLEALEQEFRTKLALLERRMTDFEENAKRTLESVFGVNEAERLFTAFQSEIAEDRDHFQSDISSLRNLLSAESEEKNSLEGTPMRIHLWNRDPDTDLYLGNYTNCCIRIDSEHMGEESTIADYLTDLGMQVVVITDEKRKIPIVAAWCFIGVGVDWEITSLVIDNIEANTDYSIPFGTQLETKLKAFIETYAKASKLPRICQGEHNNDLVASKVKAEKWKKLGGYNRPNGYFLEGEEKLEEDDE